METLKKFPRTRHLEGSRLQPGDEDLSQIPFSDVAGKRIIVEEKVDGANTAISFGKGGELLLQNRGHLIVGGERERHYHLLKSWAQVQRNALYEALGDRYIMYGEWLYAKHTVFYDALPHYFLEFDVWDKTLSRFLDTPSRRKLLSGLPVASVPVLADRAFDSLDALVALMGQSSYITEEHTTRLREFCAHNGLDADTVARQTSPTTLMEGLYIKIEGDGIVQDRMKYVRRSFSQCVDESESHWLERPIIPNQLRIPMEALYEPTLRPSVENR